MHYTGMAAATFVYEPGKLNYTGTSSMTLSAAVNGAEVASVVFMLFVFVMTMADLRMWFYNSSNALRDVDLTIAALKEDPEAKENPFFLRIIHARDGICNSEMLASTNVNVSKSRVQSRKPSIQPSSKIVPGAGESEVAGDVEAAHAGVNANSLAQALEIHATQSPV